MSWAGVVCKAAARLAREREGGGDLVSVAHLDVRHALAARGVAVVDDAHVEDLTSLRQRKGKVRTLRVGGSGGVWAQQRAAWLCGCAARRRRA